MEINVKPSMNRVHEDILNKCETITDLLNVMTEDGKINYHSIGNQGKDYSSFLRRHKFFKEYLKENLPELTLEEILKFDSLLHKFREVVYAMHVHEEFLAAIEFEIKKGLI